MTIVSNFIFMVGIFLSGLFIPAVFLKKTKIIKELYLINPFTYLNNLLTNLLTSNGNEFVNLTKGGIFNFDKDFVVFINNNEYTIFTKKIKIYNLLVPILSIMFIFLITSFKKIELEFNSKNIFFNNFKKTQIINKKSNKLIEIKNLYKTFKKQIIFKNASLLINKKDIVGVIGKNGIGKSTLFKIIMGVGNADNGTINYNFDYKNSPAEKMNFLFQTSTYPKELKVKDILNSYIDKNIDLITFNNFKKMLSIQQIWNKKSNILSGGEKQRLSLLIAILDKPDILFLDEFTSNLDIEAKFEVLKYLKKYFKKTNTACILITHDVHVLQEFCNKVILLKNHNFQIIPQKDINVEKIVKYFNLN